jgi:hypothetical protein
MRKLILSLVMLMTLLFASSAYAQFEKPLASCYDNYAGMVDWMTAQFAAFGSIMSDAERQELANANPCVCIYDSVKAASLHLDTGDAVQDMVRIENYVRDTKGLQGGKSYPIEREILIRKLNFGETLLSVWAFGMMSCTGK